MAEVNAAIKQLQDLGGSANSVYNRFKRDTNGRPAYVVKDMRKLLQQISFPIILWRVTRRERVFTDSLLLLMQDGLPVRSV